jgi:hypothetical protein
LLIKLIIGSNFEKKLKKQEQKPLCPHHKMGWFMKMQRGHLLDSIRPFNKIGLGYRLPA